MSDPTLTEAGGLWGAHRGYEFQDLVGACLLAVAVAEASGQLAIELPRKPDDVFDDLELRRDDRVVRWQVKHSDKSDRRITTADFTGQLAFKRFVDGMDPQVPSAYEYRLLATWGLPEDATLHGALVPAVASRRRARGLDGARRRRPSRARRAPVRPARGRARCAPHVARRVCARGRRALAHLLPCRSSWDRPLPERAR
jgi:hypothetical protein